MSVRVKICGIKDAAGFDAAIEVGTDWIGFNFFRPSPRWIDPEDAAVLSARAAGGPGRVGLFVDPTDAEVAAALAKVRLDALQLYVAPDRADALQARFGLPVWRAVGIESAADLPTDAGAAERLVIEAKPPERATRPGGNAVCFDWSVLRGWRAPVPWTLAGGLSPDNVPEAIRVTGARAVDVSSGVERAPGIKDPALIRAFVAAAQTAA